MSIASIFMNMKSARVAGKVSGAILSVLLCARLILRQTALPCDPDLKPPVSP